MGQHILCPFTCLYLWGEVGGYVGAHTGATPFLTPPARGMSAGPLGSDTIRRAMGGPGALAPSSVCCPHKGPDFCLQTMSHVLCASQLWPLYPAQPCHVAGAASDLWMNSFPSHSCPPRPHIWRAPVNFDTLLLYHPLTPKLC